MDKKKKTLFITSMVFFGIGLILGIIALILKNDGNAANVLGGFAIAFGIIGFILLYFVVNKIGRMISSIFLCISLLIGTGIIISMMVPLIEEDITTGVILGTDAVNLILVILTLMMVLLFLPFLISSITTIVINFAGKNGGKFYNILLILCSLIYVLTSIYFIITGLC